MKQSNDKHLDQELPRFRIFLASPGDVKKERENVRSVIKQISKEQPFRDRINLETIAWEQPGVAVPMEAALTPQEAIMWEMPKPSDCDLVIVILWSRIGTPLPPEYVKPDGSRYLSGTEWEYYDAITAFRKNGTPLVRLYRGNQIPNPSFDDPNLEKKLKQWTLVKKFFKSFVNKDGSIEGGINQYSTPDEFRMLFDHHLRDILTKKLENVNYTEKTAIRNDDHSQKQPGTIYTFYSYKGGVGRSMALANVAALLAKWGRKVLVIDFDLEAPGIEKYFDSSLSSLNSFRNTVPGIIDLIYSFIGSKKEKLSWKDCIIKCTSAHFRKELSIITAGRDDGNYISKVQNLNWDKLFNENDFGNYLETMRKEWIKEYDIILIDSRTGITDIGGICTIHLPDVVVLMFTTNDQSLYGIKDVIERARKQHETLPFDRSTLLAIPVPSRDESRTEYEASSRWKKKFSKELSELYKDWLPRNKKPEDILDLLKIPYIPYWSFGEKLPVLEEGTTDPSGIGFSFEVLAKTINSKLSWNEIVDSPFAKIS
jgi:Mrp family chromosome partitioning ATPase